MKTFWIPQRRLSGSNSVCLIALALLLGGFNISVSQEGGLEEGFLNPPTSARPRGYWAWMNGHFDKAALTRELEEAKAKGMGGLDIFDVGAVVDPSSVVPAGPPFMGEESVEGIAHAVREATRLDMEIGLVLSSSWDAGGAWIRPEHGSMGLYHSKRALDGPQSFDGALPFPETPGRGSNQNRLILEFDERGLPAYYKDVAVLALPVRGEGETIAANEVRDLTGRMDASGRLQWEVPEGRWEVVRYVCTNTGEPLKVPSPHSNGRSLDHFNPAATGFHFRHFIDKLKPALGDFRTNALDYLYLCSYEVKGATWTPVMVDEFFKRRGYSMIPYLPALEGQTIESEEATRRFHFDYQMTLSDMLIDHLYRQGSEICEANGLKLISEAGGPGPPLHNVPVDSLKALGALGIPRGEFWNKHERLDEEGFNLVWLIKEIACAAHIYGKTQVECEAFTSFRHWQEGPFELKPLADKALCEGLNRFVFHTFPHNPPDAGLPGYVYHAGTHINPTRVWWPLSKPFIEYLARCSYLLQQGRFVGDVLYYYGDQTPNFVKQKHADPSLGYGYDYDVTNSEVIMTRMFVEDGKIRLPGGLEYEMLVLPEQNAMNPDVLRKIAQFVDQGATVVGPRPVKSHRLKDYRQRDAEVRRLAGSLWGNIDGRTLQENRYGKGTVIWGRTLREVLSERGVPPDFGFKSSNPQAALDFIHRRHGETDIYFVSNETNQWTEAECSFRAGNDRKPRFWDPDDGSIRPAPLYRVDESGVTLPVRLPPHGSVFVVFEPLESGPPQFTELKWNGRLLFPASTASGEGTPSFESAGSNALRFHSNGAYRLTKKGGPVQSISVGDLPKSRRVEGSWEVRFPMADGSVMRSEFPELISWTEHELNAVKHYSGIAVYRNQFELKAEEIDSGNRAYLDLGTVREAARVFVNDVDLGIVWKQPFQVDMTRAVRTGENRLRIETANVWSNRLKGDASLPEGQRTTRTNIPGPDPWETRWKDAPLVPAGILGPAEIRFAREVVLE